MRFHILNGNGGRHAGDVKLVAEGLRDFERLIVRVPEHERNLPRLARFRHARSGGRTPKHRTWPAKAFRPRSAVISTLGTGSCFLGSAFATRTAPTSDRSRLIRGNFTASTAITTARAMTAAAQIAAFRHPDALGSTRRVYDTVALVVLRPSFKLGRRGEESIRSLGLSRRRLLRQALCMCALAPSQLAQSVDSAASVVLSPEDHSFWKNWKRRTSYSFGSRPTRRPAWSRIAAMCAHPITAWWRASQLPVSA